MGIVLFPYVSLSRTPMNLPADADDTFRIDLYSPHVIPISSSMFSETMRVTRVPRTHKQYVVLVGSCSVMVTCGHEQYDTEAYVVYLTSKSSLAFAGDSGGSIGRTQTSTL